jgi:hypothetical protein
MRALDVGVGVFAVIMAASAANASPIIDGNVTLGEYAALVPDLDSPSGQYVGNLDIDNLQYDVSNSYYNLALTVVSPPVDQTGGVTSELGQTAFWTIFYNNARTTPYYRVDVVMDSGGVQSFTLYQRSGSRWTPVTLASGDYDYAVGNAIEWRIDKSKMPNLAAEAYPRVFAQLDNTGQAPDDQIEGVVPEPATLGLLGAGLGASLLLRRRRQAPVDKS